MSAASNHSTAFGIQHGPSSHWAAHYQRAVATLRRPLCWQIGDPRALRVPGSALDQRTAVADRVTTSRCENPCIALQNWQQKNYSVK
jgi:hypothetical protein